MKKLIGFISIFWLGETSVNAQFPACTPSIKDTLKSVRVSNDNRITFSIYAPKASEVTVSGDFTMEALAAKLTKNDNGVKSFTSDAVPPDSSTYNFSVDGVNTLDTKNPTFRETPNSLFNFFDMTSP